jgi:prevent-host-death family protein
MPSNKAFVTGYEKKGFSCDPSLVSLSHFSDIILPSTIRKVRMPVIKPISDLRNKANEISNLAHDSNEPIFITRNGEGDMVVMSMASYSNLQLKLELFGKLAVAQAQRASGDRGRTVSQVMKDLRKRIRETA